MTGLYDQALEAMSREQLLALCSHQGEQISRMARERGEVLQRVEASYAKRHNAQRSTIDKQSKEIGEQRKELDGLRKVLAEWKKRGAA